MQSLGLNFVCLLSEDSKHQFSWSALFNAEKTPQGSRTNSIKSSLEVRYWLTFHNENKNG